MNGTWNIFVGYLEWVETTDLSLSMGTEENIEDL
jgi:hypothetical protein